MDIIENLPSVRCSHSFSLRILVRFCEAKSFTQHGHTEAGSELRFYNSTQPYCSSSSFVPGTGTQNNWVFYPPESYKSSSGLSLYVLAWLIVTQNKDYISQPLLPLAVAICQILPSEKRMKVMCMSFEKFPQREALCRCSFFLWSGIHMWWRKLINYLISQAEVKFRGGKSNEIKGMLVLMIS